MKIYLDDSADGEEIIAFLKFAGFEVTSPRRIGTSGKQDTEHLQVAESFGAVTLTFDGDFRILHDGLINMKRNHAGILLVCRYNNPHKDMKPHQIVKAIKNVLNLSLPIQNNLLILNQFKY